MINGWVLYDGEGILRNRAFAEVLCAEGKKHRIKMQVVIADSLTYGIKNGRLFLSAEGRSCPPPDFVIRRCYSTLLCRHLENMGARVFNNSRICGICNNKLKTCQYFQQFGIPVMDTFFAGKGVPAEDEITYPAVVKPAGGHGGRNVFLARDREEYMRYTKRVAEEDDVVIQGMASQPGRDVRVYIMGRDIVASVLRSSDVDFRSNFSLGGKAGFYMLSQDEKHLAQKIAALLDFDFAGIDFIFDKGKAVLNEIEDVAGYRMLYSLGKTDIAEIMFTHIIRELNC